MIVLRSSPVRTKSKIRTPLASTIDILPALADDMTVKQWVDNQAAFHMSLESNSQTRTIRSDVGSCRVRRGSRSSILLRRTEASSARPPPSPSLLPQLDRQLVDRTIPVGRRLASSTCRERECVLDGYGLPLDHSWRTARACIDAGLADVERASPARQYPSDAGSGVCGADASTVILPDRSVRRSTT